MRIFVTGATGFIGRHLVQKWVQDGHEVLALIREGREAPNGVQSIVGDLLEPSSYASALDGVEGVVHLAAMLDPVDCDRSAWKVNYEATLELAREATEAGARRFVFVSSIAAIGFPESSGLIPVDTNCAPLTTYGGSKRACEMALQDPARAYLPVSILRPPTVYGPGEQRNFLSLARAVATGVFPVPGSGQNRMSFCHVSNLVDALDFLLIDSDERGIFHVADPEETTLHTVASTLAEALGKKLLPLPFPMGAAKLAAVACEVFMRPLGKTPVLSLKRLDTLTRDFALDCSLLEARGFRPKTSFAEGVAETIQWYRSSGLIS